MMRRITWTEIALWLVVSFILVGLVAVCRMTGSVESAVLEPNEVSSGKETPTYERSDWEKKKKDALLNFTEELATITSEADQ